MPIKAQIRKKSYALLKRKKTKVKWKLFGSSSSPSLLLTSSSSSPDYFGVKTLNYHQALGLFPSSAIFTT